MARCGQLHALRRRDDVLRHFVPRDVVIDVPQLRIVDHASMIVAVIRMAFQRARRRLSLHRVDDAAKTCVRPDDRCLGMTPQQVLHLREEDRLAPALAKGMSMSLWRMTTSPTSRGEFEDSIECRVGEARGVAGDLGRTNSL